MPGILLLPVHCEESAGGGRRSSLFLRGGGGNKDCFAPRVSVALTWLRDGAGLAMTEGTMTAPQQLPRGLTIRMRDVQFSARFTAVCLDCVIGKAFNGNVLMLPGS